MAEHGDGGKRPRKPQPAQHNAPARDLAPTVGERVAICRRFLVARSWDDTRCQDLAEEWGVSAVTVRAHAVEAQRQLEAALDLEQVRAQLDGLLLEAADAARQEEKPAERARALCAVVKEGRELAGFGRKGNLVAPGKGKETVAPPSGLAGFTSRAKAADKPS